jgi:hypothetical protein
MKKLRALLVSLSLTAGATAAAIGVESGVAEAIQCYPSVVQYGFTGRVWCSDTRGVEYRALVSCKGSMFWSAGAWVTSGNSQRWCPTGVKAVTWQTR